MANDPLIGKQLDEYRLEEMLGQGGMARVYRALDVRLDRWVAIKVIDASFRDDTDYMTRFEREAKAIAQLEHPHIVSLYRYGEVDGVLYMAMRYIEGSALNTLLKSYRQEDKLIPTAEAHRVINQVCQALDYAHGRGVIHRDIKPANIMLDKQGNAFLADFGLALISDVGTRGEIFGTPHYISPEQAMSSASAVPQSDLYAIGVILYEMFTGELPFDADSALDVAMLHMTEPPQPPSEIRSELSPELEAVILKTLEKEPSDRYQSGAELIKALDQALKATSQVSLPLPPPSLSIPYRVAQDVAARPLPPLPAGVTPPPSSPSVASPSRAALPEQPPASPVSSPSKPTRPLVYAGLGIGALLLLGLVALILLLAGFFWLRSSGDETVADDGAVTAEANPDPAGGGAQSANAENGAAGQPAVQTGAEAGAGSEPDAAAAAQPPPAEVNAPQPSPTYELLLAKHKGDSLFLVNQSDQPFPLGPLQMASGDRLLSFSDVGPATLASGECISAWKDKGKPKAPDVSCNEVGRVSVGNKNRFWEKSFEIYYGGEWLYTCEEKQDRCQVSIPVALSDSPDRVGFSGGDEEGGDE
ncbi:MAG: serine/threonine protein kinase [Anaerolineaceae bacterium]|nr:serine/threonine protein kinase [Anaerolineaceae bacterium]MCB9099331.1 serine/threonine protein kinase [Anaerolineales bacterium]